MIADINTYTYIHRNSVVPTYPMSDSQEKFAVMRHNLFKGAATLRHRIILRGRLDKKLSTPNLTGISGSRIKHAGSAEYE